MTSATTLIKTDTPTARAVRARCQVRWTQEGGPKMGPRDLRYIHANYLSLAALCDRAGRDPAAVQARIAQGTLPQPSYVLPDGTGMFPADYFALWDAAGEDADLAECFAVRYRAAVAAAGLELADGEVEQAWADYLSGLYAVCLKQVMPETIVQKGVLVEQVERLLAAPHPADPDWVRKLRAAVDGLDALERPFTGYDRRRLGGLTSRDRLVTAVRRHYSQIATQPQAGSSPRNGIPAQR